MSPGRALITGGCGYLGTSLTHRMANGGWQITRVRRRDTACPERIQHVTELADDLADPTVWERLADGADVIIHLAAQTSSYSANQDPFADAAINVRPMLALLEWCRHQDRKPFILFASTVTIAGLTDTLPVDSNYPARPLTTYDLHKWIAEEYLKLYIRLGHARGTILRLANVYGPGCRSQRADRGILNLMIRRALAGEPLTLFGDGQSIRDYIYIADVAQAFEMAVTHRQNTNGKHWIIGSGTGHTICDAFKLIAERVSSKTGIQVLVDRVPEPENASPIEHRNFVANVAAFSAATGWTPSISLQRGIDLTIDSVLAERDRRPTTVDTL